MEVVTEELSGGHRLLGIRDCDKTFVTAFFCTKKKFSPNRKICHKIHILNMKVQLQIN